MISHEQIRDELLRRLANKEFTQKAIAALLGISAARITDIKKGARRISVDEMVKLVQFFGMDSVVAEPDEPAVLWVPVIGIASAGNWREAVAIPGYTIPIPRAPGMKNCFGVEVFGDSMDKVLPEGCTAIVNPDDKRLYDGRVYLISNHDFDATVKRYRVNPSRFEPDSHNPAHQTIFSDEHQIAVIGRVVGSWNNEGL